MDDDDELLFEDGALHRHLKDLGYTNVATAKSLSQQPLSLLRRKPTGETIDCDVIEEVITLRQANLLFEDDLDHVDCIFANFDLAKNEYLKFMFKGKLSFFVIFLGLILYLYVGGYAFILVSAYYAYRTSDYLWKKRKRLRHLKFLMKMMQSNFTLLIRIIKFLYENEQMVRNRLTSKSSHRAFNVLSGLKSDFIKVQHEINKVLADATITLIEKVPLCEYLENPECYICKNLNAYRTINNVSQLHSLYMLLQSQFLTRLIFSLIPNLVVNHKDDHYLAITDVVVKVASRLRDMQGLLNKKFKFAMLNGLCFDKSKKARQLPQKPRTSSVSQEMFVRNIHDLSNSLQFSLVKSRELEGCLENGETFALDSELTNLQNELAACQSHIADIIILHKKYSNFPLPQTERPKEDEDQFKTSENVNTRDIGFSDLDPKVDDDIFEISTDRKDNDDNPDDYTEHDMDVPQDPSDSRRHKQMLDELKTRLKLQAEDWARREAVVCSRKGMEPRVLKQQEGIWMPRVIVTDMRNDQPVKSTESTRRKQGGTVTSHVRRRLPAQPTRKPKYSYEEGYQRPEGAAMMANVLRNSRPCVTITQDVEILGSGENLNEK